MHSNPTAMVADVIKWHCGLLRTACIKHV